jgi:hypothetical protein
MIKRRSTSRLSPTVCLPSSRFARRSRDVERADRAEPERVIAIIEVQSWHELRLL